MTADEFKAAFTATLQAASVPDAETAAGFYMQDNPGIEDVLTPNEAAQEWLHIRSVAGSSAPS